MRAQTGAKTCVHARALEGSGAFHSPVATSTVSEGVGGSWGVQRAGICKSYTMMCLNVGGSLPVSLYSSWDRSDTTGGWERVHAKCTQSDFSQRPVGPQAWMGVRWVGMFKGYKVGVLVNSKGGSPGSNWGPFEYPHQHPPSQRTAIGEPRSVACSPNQTCYHYTTAPHQSLI